MRFAPSRSLDVRPAGESADDAADLALEGPDEIEGSEPPDATVLVLESGDARVGVLWDQVVQVGSLTATTVPPRIETERGQTDLVSLGLLLHGVSREEKYFVVLEQEGERAAVACERMLGLGPLSSASKDDSETRIQVLRVSLLRTFAKGAQIGAARSQHARAAGFGSPSDEDRDRNGPLRALVAVRYLPARVAICRHLRGCGWQVGEAAGLEAANVSLDLGRWDVLFLEVRSNGDRGDRGHDPEEGRGAGDPRDPGRLADLRVPAAGRPRRDVSLPRGGAGRHPDAGGRTRRS